MSRSSRLIILVAFLITSIVLLVTPYGSHYGHSQTLFQQMEPRENNGYTDPFAPFALFVPVIIMLISLIRKFPFSNYLRLLFGLLFIASMISTLMLMFLGVFNSANFLHTVIFFYAFGSSLWCLLLSIPGTSEWKWVRWPFEWMN